MKKTAARATKAKSRPRRATEPEKQVVEVKWQVEIIVFKHRIRLPDATQLSTEYIDLRNNSVVDVSFQPEQITLYSKTNTDLKTEVPKHNIRQIIYRKV